MAHQHSPRFLEIVADAKKRVREVTVDDVKGKLDRNEEFLLVDVREDKEWEKDHLPNAVHLGKGVIERDIETASRRPQRAYRSLLWWRFSLCACRRQSGKMGYTNVVSMDGGIREWREKGYPLARGDAILRDWVLQARVQSCR